VIDRGEFRQNESRHPDSHQHSHHHDDPRIAQGFDDFFLQRQLFFLLKRKALATFIQLTGDFPGAD